MCAPLRLFETAYEAGKLGKPVDRDEWHMTPQTVNAYYNPVMNEIVFTRQLFCRRLSLI